MIADELLDDGRTDRIERALRAEFPRLPEGAELLSYVQLPMEAEINGVTRLLETVVFGIKVPNPRRPRRERLMRATWPLKAWRSMESSHKRIVGYPDPALHAFQQLAPKVIDWYETQRDLIGEALDFDDEDASG